MTTEVLIETSELWKTYFTDSIPLNALKGINLKVYPGEFIAIMGASGSGKSTLMNILGCLDIQTKGDYLFSGLKAKNLSKPVLALLRSKKFGFVFQSYNLLPRTTSFDNVELPLLYGSKFSKKKRIEIVTKALEKVGLSDKIFSKPNQLSGGQQQRVAIARAIVNNPAIIFADEPTGNLDTRTSFEIISIFQELNRDGTTIILVTHENDIADFAKRKIIFRDGRILSDIKNETPKNALIEMELLPKED
jgi:putative ABC transport system ATP-binding protein